MRTAKKRSSKNIITTISELGDDTESIKKMGIALGWMERAFHTESALLLDIQGQLIRNLMAHSARFCRELPKGSPVEVKDYLNNHLVLLQKINTKLQKRFMD